jgi:hypothetical protein
MFTLYFNVGCMSWSMIIAPQCWQMYPLEYQSYLSLREKIWIYYVIFKMFN